MPRGPMQYPSHEDGTRRGGERGPHATRAFPSSSESTDPWEATRRWSMIQWTEISAKRAGREFESFRRCHLLTPWDSTRLHSLRSLAE